MSTGKKGNSHKQPSRKLSFKNMKTLNEPHNYLRKEEAKKSQNKWIQQRRNILYLFIYLCTWFFLASLKGISSTWKEIGLAAIQLKY